MLFSIAMMLFCGLLFGGIMRKFQLPGLMGMMFAGMFLGPYACNLISPDILAMSDTLRQMALLVVLIRAGLALHINDLKKVGRPAILMSFLPATFEIVATTLFAPMFFPISRLEAAILGAVLGAVSPAVIVPKMLMLMEKGYGTDKHIPQLVMAGASVDDIYVIVLFTSFLSMYGGGDFSAKQLIQIPVSILVGLLVGILCGWLLAELFRRISIRDTVKSLLLLSTAFLLVFIEERSTPYLPLSGLLAVIALGGTILYRHTAAAKRLSVKFSKIWVAAELMLFILVGATVDLRYILQAGFAAAGLIAIALLMRMCGVYVCLIKNNLTIRERIFCGIAYLPKATVQAAIGGIALTQGVEAGSIILTVAVLSIFITAPLGAMGIDWLYPKLLQPASKK